MKIKAVMFDLDGTLIQTLLDIRNALNVSLAEAGINASYSVSKVKDFVGGGALHLLVEALKPFNLSAEKFEQVKEIYGRYYKLKQGETSSPFRGIMTLLKVLKKLKVDAFVLTNKPDKLAKEIIAQKIGSCYFKEVLGATSNLPLKPDKAMLEYLVKKYKLKKEEILYVGDMHYDIEFAKNAGVKVALLTYGYDVYNEALISSSDYHFKSVFELRKFIEKSQ